MDNLRKIIEPSLESALTDIGVTGDFWKKALGTSREKAQGDLSLPCFPFAKQLGRNPAEIAEQLFIPPKTVENHRRNISQKLNLSGRNNSLLSWALEHKQEF